MSHSARIYADRTEAGIELASEIRRRKLPRPAVVLGLPRGGVPVAYEVARALDAPLDIMVVRKLGMPGQPELAIGAIASGGIVVGEPEGPKGERGRDPLFAGLVERERAELQRRERAYRGGVSSPALANRTVILVDDGVATGATMLAAIRAARKAGATTVIAAAPVASDEAAERVAAEADHAVFLQVPAFLYAIGQWYDHFEQLEDEDVLGLLRSAARDAPSTRA